MQPERVSGIILAGGASRRMGRNKALIALEGQPLVARVLHALRPVTDEVLVVANDPAPFAFLSLPVVPDSEPGHGPLMGLYSGMRAARGDLVVAVAVDMPFLTPEFLEHLVRLSPGYDVVIPETDRLHPLCAVYRRETCLPAIEEALARGQRRLIAFHADVQVRRVPEAALRSFSPDLRALINVNTPEELEKARELLGGEKTDGRGEAD
jgi:molybdopterin-guanine dinucleotide biosynthesis protein A